MRDIPVGNGSLLVNFDEKYQIRDIYFPHVGQENHTEGFPFRFGVWVDDAFSWVSSDVWERSLDYLHDTLVTDVSLRCERLGITLRCNDTVASHENIFLRRVRLTNDSDREREIRVFLHHDFRIYENRVGDTAYFDPDTRTIIHYKKHRYFLIGTDPGFTQFVTGRKAFRDQEGTWRDAEDGILRGSAITEGSADSTIGCSFVIGPGEMREFYYWIAAGTSYGEVCSLHEHTLSRGPEQYLAYTENYWRAWVNKNERDLEGVTPAAAELYKRSLLMIQTQTDGDGAILAANDSDVTERATDHYSYLWTRDGAFVANALDLAGYSNISKKFFEFCGKIVNPAGYFLQKYNADGTVASGWHASWDVHHDKQLVPIQEDETGLVLWALWQHYDLYRDLDFCHRLYRKLVVPCANFMTEFRNSDSGLPEPSWNLWEDRRGVHTFTCCTVVAGLRAAAKFANLFAEETLALKYGNAADEIVAAMARDLYDPELGRFLRSLQDNGVALEPDATVDASLFAIFYFDCFAVDDPMVEGTMNAVRDKLAVEGGIARFENDPYMRGTSGVSNAWHICTLWVADYFIAAANTAGDLEKAHDIIEWVAARTRTSGVLAEQYDTSSGEHVSVSPLTWSHSTFVATVENYLKRRKDLK